MARSKALSELSCLHASLREASVGELMSGQHPKEVHLEAVTLLSSTGEERTDRVARAVISVFATTFSGRIRACYLEGSRADGTSVSTSDFDFTIVFGGSSADEERDRAAQLANCCEALSVAELDIDLTDEARLSGGVPPMLKLSSRLLYGEDVVSRAPLMTIEEWRRDRMHSSYWLMVKVFGRPPIVEHPVGYPDPAGEFYGYDNRRLRLPNGSEVNSTRNLIRVTGWMATALVALLAGEYVESKRACHAAYRRGIGDEWGTLLEDIYHLCRGEWNYLIPEGEWERQRLRAICARTLEFEKHFLGLYKPYLLSELHGADTKAKRRAVWVMGQIPFRDREVFATLVALRNAGELQSEVKHTLERFGNN